MTINNTARSNDSLDSSNIRDDYMESTREKPFTPSVHSAYSFTDLSSLSPFTIHSEDKDWKTFDVKKLSEKLKKRINDVIRALKNYDAQGEGKVLPSKLHNVLQVFCCPLSLEDFNSLIKKEHLDENGLVKYAIFISDILPNQRHLYVLPKTDEEREDVSNYNTEELEIKIKQKISRNIKNVVRALWMYDYNKDGLIQRDELRTVIENYCFKLSDDQFEKFWSLYDPKKDGVINYKDFLLKLGTHAESYKRYMPKDILAKVLTDSAPFRTVYTRHEQVQRRYARQGRDDPAVQGKAFTNVIDVFKDKVKKNAPLLLRAFKMKDSSQSGYVTTSVFHQTLNYFVMPMSSQLFKQIMTKLQISSKDTRIPWYDFLKSICLQSEFKNKEDSLILKVGDHKWSSCCEIIEKLRKQGKSPQNFFNQSFTIYNHNKRIVTRAELKRTINQALVFPINEEEFRKLMFILDPGHTNLIECQSFLSLFNTVPMRNNTEVENVSEVSNLQCTDDADDTLTGARLKQALKKKFNRNFKNIERAFFTVDAEETGTINIADLRKILEVFCFFLKDSQFKEILSDFTIAGSRIVYNHFIKFYRKNLYEDADKWAHCVKRLTTDENMPRRECNMTHLVEHVKEAVRAHKGSFEEEFKAQDYCSVGIARKETLLRLLNRFVYRLSSKQFDTLWDLLPRNEIGFLIYDIFLKEWGKPVLEQSAALLCTNQVLQSARDNDLQSDMPKKGPPSTFSFSSKKRPKTAGSLSSARSRAHSRSSSKASPCRPKSASSNLSSYGSRSRSLANLNVKDISSNDNLFVEGKAVEGNCVLTQQQYKRYRSLDFESSVELPNLKAALRENKPASGKKVKQSHSLLSTDNGKQPKHSMSMQNKDQLQNIIRARWRDVLRRCKACDKENCDAVPKEKLTDILEMIGISITEDIEEMLEKYYAKGSSLINYWDFLQQFLLFLNSRPPPDNFLRKQLPRRRNSVILGRECTGLYKALLTCRDKILKNFRSLRHCFHTADLQHTGGVEASEFRKILAHFKINLSGDEFFFIQDYFDQRLSGSINYNEFLRVFIEE